MKIERLIEKKLLKKESPDIEKSRQSIKVAQTKLDNAKKSVESDLYESAIIFSYMAMFHAARAILFKEGYTEKSHFAVVEYLKERHSRTIGTTLISRLNTLKTQRHEGLYGLEADFTKEDAELAVKHAKEFLQKIKALIPPKKE